MKRNGAAGVNLAPFAAVAAAPADAEMLAAHPDAWLQLDPAPQLPASGLRVERRYALPAPDPLDLEPPPAELCMEPRPANSHAAAAVPRCPLSDLAPLGWDPRAICRKGDR